MLLPFSNLKQASKSASCSFARRTEWVATPARLVVARSGGQSFSGIVQNATGPLASGYSRHLRGTNRCHGHRRVQGRSPLRGGLPTPGCRGNRRQYAFLDQCPGTQRCFFSGNGRLPEAKMPITLCVRCFSRLVAAGRPVGQGSVAKSQAPFLKISATGTEISRLTKPFRRNLLCCAGRFGRSSSDGLGKLSDRKIEKNSSNRLKGAKRLAIVQTAAHDRPLPRENRRQEQYHPDRLNLSGGFWSAEDGTVQSTTVYCVKRSLIR